MTNVKILWLTVIAGLAVQEVGTQAATVTFYTTPASPTNAIVFQVPGIAFTNWYAVSNLYSGDLNRSDITNILNIYFTANATTNYGKYSSLFKTNEAPANDGGDSVAPSVLWLKSIYFYGPFTIADVRFELHPDGTNLLHDSLIYLRREGTNYYLLSEFSDPAVCLLEAEMNHTLFSNGMSIAIGGWTASGYFSKTNYAFGTNYDNAWVTYIPGIQFTNFIVTGSSPTVTNSACCPETAVIIALQSLIADNTNNYLSLICTNEIWQTNEYFNMTAYARLTNYWSIARSNYAGGARLEQRIILNDKAYILFSKTNGIALRKDWLFLTRTNSLWSVSGKQEEEGNRLLYYLFDTCTQFTYRGPKVLPMANW